jgi:hypothetical protein
MIEPPLTNAGEFKLEPAGHDVYGDAPENLARDI